MNLEEKLQMLERDLKGMFVRYGLECDFHPEWYALIRDPKQDHKIVGRVSGECDVEPFEVTEPPHHVCSVCGIWYSTKELADLCAVTD